MRRAILVNGFAHIDEQCCMYNGKEITPAPSTNKIGTEIGDFFPQNCNKNRLSYSKKSKKCY